jgi:gliding motility-associated-like protein
LKQNIILFLLFFLSANQISFSQNITVNSDLYSDQQLIEEVLIGTNCVDNVIVSNTVSGNFSNGELSYGYFNANDSGFPFNEGLVLSTGRLSNVPGPNNNLSDDDAPNWDGDQDLEDAIGIDNTLNATIFEFSFVPQSTSINFRYLFASEEYRENEPTTCQFSDAFAFLIRPVGGEYENLALVPGTNTPVQVTTVRPEIPGACEALNEEYFDQFNGTFSPINFNGQTTILTAETIVELGQTYEIKLVIADETNFRFDSAVFIEANSFNVGVDLGQDQTLCENESLNLQITNNDALGIRWFYDGLLFNDSDDEINVSQDNFGSGLYTVEVDLPGGCTAIDEVNIFFDVIEFPEQLSVTTCLDEDGFGVYNLTDVTTQINPNLQVISYHNTLLDAENGTNPINTPNFYPNTVQNEVIFIRVLSPSNCFGVKDVLLLEGTEDLGQIFFTSCPGEITTSFEIEDIKSQVAVSLNYQEQVISLFETENDAIAQTNEILTDFFDVENDNLPSSLFVRVDAEVSCEGLAEVILNITDVIDFVDNTNQFLICEDNTIELSATLENFDGEVVYSWNTGETTENITVEESGEYSVEVVYAQIIEGQEVECSIIKNISVVVSGLPEVTFTQTGFVGLDNQLIINATGSGDYEYALNDSGFVDSNIFNIEQTENTLFVRDRNGCGVVSLSFVALRIPDFFTPNGDGFNDYWQIEGIRQSENDISTIYIFDRYGKLLYQSSPQLIGWDGTYNGAPVPPQDYWYKIQLNSGKSLTGHLTLKR